jgi:hypothetical protein
VLEKGVSVPLGAAFSGFFVLGSLFWVLCFWRMTRECLSLDGHSLCSLFLVFGVTVLYGDARVAGGFSTA